MREKNRKKRILQVLYSGLGGHGTVAFSLVDGFAKKDYDVFLFFYGIEPMYEGYIIRCNKSESIVDFYSVQKKTKVGFREWIRYYKYLRKIRPNVILLHMPNLILATYIYKIFNKVKIVSVEHDSISLRTKFKWFVSNLNSILADRMVVLTDPYKKSVYNNLWFKNMINKYVVIPNGIDTSKFNEKKQLFNDSEVNIFMASRMNKLRDHETLIKAVKELNKQGYNIVLRIAGSGETLKRLKEKYQNDEVYFLGNLEGEKIIEELGRTDIYIHATLAETFSTAILQAMSCGLPIITTDIAGTKHMIQHKNNGLLFNVGDVSDLKNKIVALIRDKEKAKEYGKIAREKVINSYRDSVVVKKYIDVFE